MKNFDSTWPVRFSLLFIFFFIFEASAQNKGPQQDESGVVEELKTMDPLTELVPEIVEHKKDSPVSTFLLQERLRQLQKEIPLRYNEYSHNYVDFFTEKRPHFTQRMLETKDLYFPIFEEKLAKYKLPEELKYLSLIESGLNPRIVSRAGAGGLWQFMRATGRELGLTQNSYIDERFHPEKSTEAACRYLKQLYNIFGDWEMVLAAYNCGPGNVRRAIRRTGRNDFWGIYPVLPKETRNYVPQYVAMVYMMHYAHDHGIVPSEYRLHAAVDTLHVNGYLNLRTFAQLSGMSLDDIYELNPHLIGSHLPASNPGFALRVPAINAALIRDNLYAVLDSSAKVPAGHSDMIAGESRVVRDGYELVTTSLRHTVKSGQTLSSIARKYGTTVSKIREWNNLKSTNLRVGQRLVINQTVRQRIPAPAPAVQPAKETAPVVLADAKTKEAISEASSVSETVASVSEEDVRSIIETELALADETDEEDEPLVAANEVTVVPELPQGTVMTEEMLLARQAARLQLKSKEEASTAPAPAKQLVAEKKQPVAPTEKAAIKGDRIEHTIRKGETLMAISRKYNVSVQDIQEANQLHGTNLVAGKKLVIVTPKTEAPKTVASRQAPAQKNPIYHVVQSGDTLWDISRKYGLSVDKIKKVNNIKGNSLKAGMKILISG